MTRPGVWELRFHGREVGTLSLLPEVPVSTAYPPALVDAFNRCASDIAMQTAPPSDRPYVAAGWPDRLTHDDFFQLALDRVAEVVDTHQAAKVRQMLLTEWRRIPRAASSTGELAPITPMQMEQFHVVVDRVVGAHLEREAG